MRTPLWRILGGVAIVGLLLGLSLVGCTSAPAPTPAPKETTASVKPTTEPAKPAATKEAALTGSASKEPYKIGAVLDITGPASSLGIPSRNSALLWEEEINKKGGIDGHPVKVIIYDGQSDTTQNVLAAKKLIDDDKVLAIVGPTQTGTTLAIADIAEKAGVPVIASAVGSDIVTPVKKWIFKSVQSDVDFITMTVNYLKKMNISKVGFLSVSNAYGDSGRVAFEKAAKAAGIEIVASEKFADKDTDLTVQLTKIKGGNPQAIVYTALPPAAAVLHKNAVQLGINIPLINTGGIPNAAFIQLAGDAANGAIAPANKLLVAGDLPDTDRQKPVLLAYEKAYKQKFNVEPEFSGAISYDGLEMVGKALAKVGPDRAKIRDEIEKTKDYVGLIGIFNLSPTEHSGTHEEALVMVQVKNGKWTLIK